jgi:ribosome-associated toxin RatA of RatAB toxin-antitoxin module
MQQAVLLLFLLVIPAMHAQERPRHDSIRANANRVVRNGEPYFEVKAVGVVRATPQQAWTVLTDYDRLPEFIPDLLTVKVLSRSGNTVRIEQRSSAGFLFVWHTIRMELHIEENPSTSIHVALVEGDMHRYDTHWYIEPMDQGSAPLTRITFSGVMEPKFPVPPLFGPAIVEANLKRTVEAVVTEIERRTAH